MMAVSNQQAGETMTIKLTNQTHYANMYALYDDNGKVIGTKQVTLAGVNAGTYYASWSHYTKRDIKRLFNQTGKR